MENKLELKTSQSTKDAHIKFAFDIIWVALSQVITALLGIITLPALTKTYTSETYGLWVQISITVILIVPLISLGFNATVVRFLAGEDDRSIRRRSLGAMLSTIVIFAILTMIVVNTGASQFSTLLFGNPSYTYLVRLTMLWVFIDAMYVFFISYMRARRRIKGLSIIETFFSASKVISIVVVAKIGLPLEWIVISMVLIELIFVIVVLYIHVREEGFPIPNFAGLKIFLVFSIPQMFSGFLLWIINASDRYLITHFLGLSNTGIYSSANSIASIISFFYYPINFVLLPTISRAWEQKRITEVRDYLKYSTKIFLVLAIPAAGGVTVLSQTLLQILATTEYVVGWDVVLFVAIGTIFLGIYFNNLYVIYLTKQTKWLALMILVASVVSVGINLLLIPKLGILGAAIANMISYFILAMIVTIWARKVINYDFDFKFLSKVITATLIMALILILLNLNGIWGVFLAIIIGFTIYITLLIIFRAFSEHEKYLIKRALAGIFSKFYKRDQA